MSPSAAASSANSGQGVSLSPTPLLVAAAPAGNGVAAGAAEPMRISAENGVPVPAPTASPSAESSGFHHLADKNSKTLSAHRILASTAIRPDVSIGRRRLNELFAGDERPRPGNKVLVGSSASYNLEASALFVLGPYNPIRVTCFDIVNSKAFEAVVLAIIVLNSVTLAMDIPATEDNSGIQSFLYASEIFFLAAFSIEMITKAVALGFVNHEHSYLRNTWNVIDFIILLAGYAGYTPALSGGAGGTAVLRLVRVVRPLRTVSRVAGMRTIMTTIITSIPNLLEVVFLLGFLMLIFSITGINLFAGKWHDRCHVDVNASLAQGFVLPQHVIDGALGALWFVRNDADTPCSRSPGGRSCMANGVPYPQVCTWTDQVAKDQILNFDNIFNALLLSFKIISLDDWPIDMHKGQNATSFAAFIYFFIVTFIGAYFCINLVLALLSLILDEEKGAELIEAVQLGQVKFRYRRSEVNMTGAVAANPGGVNNAGEDPQKVLDGKKDTKWADQNLDQPYIVLEITFPKPTPIDEYTFVTACDAPRCDPVRWTLSCSPQVSEATDRWFEVDALEDDFSVPIEREAALPWIRVQPRTDARSYRFVISRWRWLQEDDGDLDSVASPVEPSGMPECVPLSPPGVEPRVPSPLTNCHTPPSSRPDCTVEDMQTLERSRVSADQQPSPHRQPSGDVAREDSETPSSMSSPNQAKRRRSSLMDAARRISETQPSPSTAGRRNSTDWRRRSSKAPRRSKHPQHGFPSLQYRVRHFVEHQLFGGFVLCVTLANILCMAMDHYPIDQDFEWWLSVLNFAFSVFFLFEMLLKWFAYCGTPALRGYLKDRYSMFDCLLVFISIPEITLALVNGFGSGTAAGGATNAFRAFRLARVARIAQRLPELKTLLETIVVSLVGDAPYLFLISLLFIFIFGILGLRLFRNQFPEDTVSRAPQDYSAEERSNFRTFYQSLLTVFVLITGESWATIMKHGMLGTHWSSFLYFVIVFLFGNYLLLNLVIAILIVNFSNESQKRKRVEMESREQQEREEAARTRLISADLLDTLMEATAQQESPPAVVDASTSGPAAQGCAAAPTEGSHSLVDLERAPSNTWDLTRMVVQRPPTPVHGPKRLWKGLQAKRSDMQPDGGLSFEEQAEVLGLRGTSLGLFPATNRVRITIAKVVLDPLFDLVIIVLIMVNIVFLSVDGVHFDGDKTARTVIDVADYVFSGLFCLEAAAKIIALGLWGTDHRRDPQAREGYLRSLWNRIDLFVAVTSLLGIGIATFKVFRSLRAIRIIVLSDAVKLLVLSLLVALPQIGYVCLVCSFMWLVFGILGVQLFKGTFYYCTDVAVVDRVNCTGNYTLNQTEWDGPHTVTGERKWVRTRYHFDDVGHAMLTLFEVAVGEGWATIMYTGMDSSLDPEKGLQRNQNQALGLFFVAFVIIGGFFAINLFVGTLIEQFSVQKEKLTGLTDDLGRRTLTDRQMEWLTARKITSRCGLHPRTRTPDNPVLQLTLRLVTHRHFDHLVMALILVNVLFMCMARDDQDAATETMLRYVNLIFVILYTLECVLKLVGLTPIIYFSNNWNRFDFLLVLCGYLGLVINGAATNSIRVLRIGRVFRLIKRAKSLQKLFATLMYALPSLGNISVFLLIIFFVFGVIGVSIFGNIMMGCDSCLGDNGHFRNLGSAMVLLYTIATTEGWTDVMNACRIGPDSGCIQGPNCGSNCCGSDWAVLYFPLFILVGSMIALNLFITVLIDQFQVEEDLFSDDNQNKLERFNLFQAQWVHFDAAATGFIPAAQFFMILRNLPDDMLFDLGMQGVSQGGKRGVKGRAVISDLSIMRFLRDLDLVVTPASAVPNSEEGSGNVRSIYVSYRDAQRALALRLFHLDAADAACVSAIIDRTPVMDSRHAFRAEHYFAARKITQLVRKVGRTRMAGNGGAVGRNWTDVLRSVQDSMQTATKLPDPPIGSPSVSTIDPGASIEHNPLSKGHGTLRRPSTFSPAGRQPTAGLRKMTRPGTSPHDSDDSDAATTESGASLPRPMPAPRSPS